MAYVWRWLVPDFVDAVLVQGHCRLLTASALPGAIANAPGSAKRCQLN
jgi:hypothetical protein